MTVVLDAGAFLAVDRDDRDMAARLRVAQRRGLGLRTHAMVVAQAWRNGARQANLARLLAAVDVRSVTEDMGRDAGVLLGRAGTDDPIDAALVLLAADGDHVVTSDPGDVSRLAAAAGRAVTIVRR